MKPLPPSFLERKGCLQAFYWKAVIRLRSGNDMLFVGGADTKPVRINAPQSVLAAAPFNNDRFC
jgi:hypothetical protein